MTETGRLKFGEFEIDVINRQLSRRGSIVDVQAKVLDAIVFMAKNAGRLITYEELFEALWPDVNVSKDALAQTIRKMRVVLGDDARHPQCVESVPRHGYRFAAAVVHEPSTALHERKRPRSTLLGRDRELAELESLLDGGQGQIVTVHGPGGIGKTRLVTELSAVHDAECLWVPLADARTVSDCSLALARAVGASLCETDESAVGTLGQALRDAAASIVVLDNVDALAGPLGPVLTRLRALAPAVSFVLTSRVVLGLPEETRLELGALPVPAAVELFHRRSVEVRSEHRDSVERLVRRLDGNPLAIELAARRTALLTPPEILARLGQRIRMLAGGDERRQRSLNAVLDWSWDLLDDGARDALMRCALFPDRFSIADAEALLDSQAAWPMERLQTLCDHAWLQADASTWDRRLGLSESAREYVLDHLDRSPDAARTVAEFATAVLRTAEPLAEEARKHAAKTALERLGELLSRLLVAHQWSIRFAADPSMHARLALAAEPVLRVRGPWSVLLNLVEQSLSPGVSERLQADLHHAVIDVCFRLGDDTATGRHLEALERLSAGLDDLEMALTTARFRGALARRQGNLPLALEHVTRALDLARSKRHDASVAAACESTALLLVDLGRVENAEQILNEGIAACRTPNEDFPKHVLLGQLGTLQASTGRYAEAEASLRAARAWFNRTNAPTGEVLVLVKLARLLVEKNRGDAQSVIDEGMRLAQKTGDVQAERWLLLEHETCAIARGDLDSAEQGCRQVEESARTARDLQSQAVAEHWLGLIAHLRGAADVASSWFASSEQTLRPPPTCPWGIHVAARTAAALADSGDIERARAVLDAVPPDACRLLPVVERVLELARAHVEIAVARDAGAWNDAAAQLLLNRYAEFPRDTVRVELGWRVLELAARL